MKIKLTSVLVDDQEKALRFYTEVLGFVKKQEFPVGEFKWLTVVSPDEPTGVELALEPDVNPASKAFKTALYSQQIPCTSFSVDDLQQEYRRLRDRGVAFSKEPTAEYGKPVAVFDDGCGNFIQLEQD